MTNKIFYIYIMTNKNNTALYTGVTSNLKNRVLQHKEKVHPDSFTAKYNINKLVYYETADNPLSAIEREKQIKAGSRQKKISLINDFNTDWKDLYDDI